MTTCKNCGAELAENVKFCPKCGTKNEPKHFCSSCGAELQPNAKFCPKCGANQIEKTQQNVNQSVVQPKEQIFQSVKQADTENVLTKERILKFLPNLFLILVFVSYFWDYFEVGDFNDKFYCNSVLECHETTSIILITLSEICAFLTFLLSIVCLIKKISLMKIITITKNLGLLLFVAEIIFKWLFFGRMWFARDGFYMMCAGWLLSSIRIPLGKK